MPDFNLKCLHCHQASYVDIHYLATTVQSRLGFSEGPLWIYNKNDPFICLAHIRGRVCKFSVKVSTLSPKASLVQVHFLSNPVQSTRSFVTECLYSLHYESYSNISKAHDASFHLQCLCCHQKPAACKYTSLATTVKSSGVLVTLVQPKIWMTLSYS